MKSVGTLKQSAPICQNDDGSFSFDGTGISFRQDSDDRLIVYRSDTTPNVVLLITSPLQRRIV